MASTTIAEAYVQILPSTKGLANAITDEVGSDVAKSGKKIGSGLGSAIAGGLKVAGVAIAATTAAIGALTTKSVQAYAEYEQLTGGVETLFGTQGMSLKEYADSIGSTVADAISDYHQLEKAQDMVMKSASEAYKTAGLSANEYMEQATSTAAAMVSSVHGDTEKAAQMADQAIIDMSDNANKMGTSIESIQNAYNGFAKGNFTMLDNLKLGYGGTKEEMQRLLEDAEAISGIKYDISSYADVTEAIHIMQEQMGIAGTTAKEAESTISGSLGMVKASWENVLTAMGNKDADLSATITQLVDSVAIFAGNVLPIAKQALSGITQLIGQLAPEIAGALPELVAEVVPSLVSSVVAVLQALIDGIRSNLNLITSSGFEILNTLIDAIVDLLPDLLDLGLQMVVALAEGLADNIDHILAQAVNLIDKVGQTIIKNLPKILVAGIKLVSAIIEGIGNNLPALIQTLTEIGTQIAATLVKSSPELIVAGIDLLVALINGLIQTIPVLVENLPMIINAIKQAFRDIDWAELGRQIINGIVNGIKSGVESIKKAAREAAKSALDSAKNALSIHSPSRLFDKEVGLQIDVGWARGIRNNAKLVSSATKDVSSLAYDTAKVSSVSASGKYTASSYAPQGATMDGVSFTLNDTISLDGTPLKERCAQYTIRKIGNQYTAVRTARGGR